jgi:hypothetical protein
MSSIEYEGPQTGNKDLEQFFTPFSLVDRCLDIVKLEFSDSPSPKKILEPSAGTGQFCKRIKKVFPRSKLISYEIDPEIAWKLSKIENFLTVEINTKFDLIIGNPPYSELKPEDRENSKWSKCITGRYNIYALFVEKCVELLSDNGILVFIIPPGINTCPSFAKLRKFISSKCSIRHLEKVDEFPGVCQDTQIFCCKRVDNPSESMNIFGNNLYGKLNINESFSNTLESIANVKTGPMVWNQCKKFLVSEDSGIRLLYSKNISGGGLQWPAIKDKDVKQGKLEFVCPESGKEELVLPVILASRTKIPKFIFVKECSHKLIAENHINVISVKRSDLSVEEKTDLLETLYKKLTGSFGVEYFISISSSLNVGATQLKNFPIEN